jgi:hypothetical protein
MIYKVLPYAGKERLFMEVARLLQKKIYVGAAKLQILKHLELPQEIMHWFTANETESHIHVVPMWTLASFKRMKFLSNQYAVRPSIHPIKCDLILDNAYLRPVLTKPRSS